MRQNEIYGTAVSQGVRPGRSTKSQGHMMSVKGKYIQAPPSMNQGIYGTLPHLANQRQQQQQQQQVYGMPQTMGYGNNVANPIYGGLPSSPRSPASPDYSQMLLAAATNGAGTMTLSPELHQVIDPETEVSPWYLVGRPREAVKRVAVEILKNGEIGEFFVREVSSHRGSLGLSIKTSQRDLTNYLLKAMPTVVGHGVTIRGTKEVFKNVSSLIDHYRSRKRPSLPCKLVESSKIRGAGKYHTNVRGKKLGKSSLDNFEDSDDEGHFGFGDDEESPVPPKAATPPPPPPVAIPDELKERIGAMENGIAETLGLTKSHLQNINRESRVVQSIDESVQRALKPLMEQEQENKSLRPILERQISDNSLLQQKVEKLEKEISQTYSGLQGEVKKALEPLIESDAIKDQRTSELQLKLEQIQLEMNQKFGAGQELASQTRLAAAIQNSVSSALKPYMSSKEKKLAKKKALLARRKLALQQHEMKLLGGNALSENEREYVAGVTSSRYSDSPEPDFEALSILERARGSTLTSPRARTPQSTSPLSKPQNVLDDPTAMWELLSTSDAPQDKKMAAAEKQLEYLRKQEQLTIQRLKAAEAALNRPVKFGDDDTVFDDHFENGTIVDEATGDVYGFGAF